MSETTVKLPYTPPYDWEHVRDFLAMRAIPGVERVDASGYVRTIATPNGYAIVSVRPENGNGALALRVRGVATGALGDITATAQRAFGLNTDPARIAKAFKADTLLAPLVSRRPGLRVVGAWDPFECAVRAVLGQQVSVAAGRTLAARLVTRAGKAIANGDGGLTHVFPGPAAVERANLDGLGITGARIKALRALARAVVEGTVDFTASAEQVAARLVTLPGFGHWTAQYIAMRALGDADAFPTGDLVLRRMAAGDGAASPLTAKELSARADAWRPWRAYATFHLWRATGD